MMKFDVKKAGLFLGGVLFGTAGIKALSSKDAKKAYVHTVAAALRAKESVMQTVTKVQENAGDVLAEAKAVNEDRDAKEAAKAACGEEACKADEENTEERDAKGYAEN